MHNHAAGTNILVTEYLLSNIPEILQDNIDIVYNLPSQHLSPISNVCIATSKVKSVSRQMQVVFFHHVDILK